MQSRVFWGQMAAHDLDHTPLLVSNVQQTPATLLQNSYCNFGRDSDTDAEKHSNESLHDAVLPVNEVPEALEISQSQIRLPTELNVTENELIEQEDGVVIPEDAGNEEKYRMAGQNAPRAFGPLDEGHGSMDSGFSDSERSRSPDFIDNGGRRRRRRRRRSLNRPRGNHGGFKFQSFWRDNEIPNPAHTSTPKRQSLR